MGLKVRSSRTVRSVTATASTIRWTSSMTGRRAWATRRVLAQSCSRTCPRVSALTSSATTSKSSTSACRVSAGYMYVISASLQRALKSPLTTTCTCDCKQTGVMSLTWSSIDLCWNSNTISCNILFQSQKCLISAARCKNACLKATLRHQTTPITTPPTSTACALWRRTGRRKSRSVSTIYCWKQNKVG